ncbi:alpha/beta fold hydrolase [Nonomuraea sp. SMC257]|uniref:Alpha/beta fold hydrolase n=1 Tax=Nonomuraea montanisoli TaxID=2741721 RepID=A0A7Y6M6H2_9ACTN|nr:alpha/beta fold hydrolase [Nonomuraea montanisoli]NUW35596.1 alpha/beta fold hydrolase [Nonomuraea montanisoli]
MLQHRLDGPEHGSPIILGPSLGTSARVWEPQLTALAHRFRVVRFDLPGHGGSPVQDVSSVDDLAGLVLELADALGLDAFHYAGISLGGAIGATLAARRPGRVLSLAMVCSSARFGRRTRSCVTLTALVAHGHLDELALHVRAALRNGLTPDEIGEVLLQSAIYCGVPAANAAFGVAQCVLSEVSGEPA